MSHRGAYIATAMPRFSVQHHGTRKPGMYPPPLDPHRLRVGIKSGTCQFLLKLKLPHLLVDEVSKANYRRGNKMSPPSVPT
jgi:hypothetical protein